MANEKEMTFEECLKRLNELVEKLEKGDLDLDESLKVFEEAVVLKDLCKKKLEETERKVNKIIETAEGLKEEKFTPQ